MFILSDPIQIENRDKNNKFTNRINELEILKACHEVETKI